MRNLSIVLLILLFAGCGPYVPADLPEGYEEATVEIVVYGRKGCMTYLKVQSPEGGEPYCMWLPCSGKEKVGRRSFFYNYSGQKKIKCSDVHRLEVKID